MGQVVGVVGLHVIPKQAGSSISLTQMEMMAVAGLTTRGVATSRLQAGSSP